MTRKVYKRNGMEKTNSSNAGIREVARLARVSPATVSRVLNGAEQVGEEYRRRVLDAVAQTDYRPNRLARNLRRQRAEMIGVAVSDIENPHFSEAVRVVEDEAYRAGYRVLLCNTDETPEKQRAYLEMLADERVVAAIVSPADAACTGVEALLALDIPVVAFDREILDPRADAVVCDNVAGARRATEHLIWLGHERIAFLGGNPEVETGAERLQGYTDAMRAAGLLPFSLGGGFRADAAQAAVTDLLALATPPTALVVANNLMTLGTLRAVRDAEVKVPHDLAVVSFDDPPWAELVDPPLTTLAQPVRRMASNAMQLALERVEGDRTEPRRIVLPLEFRVRSSCGARGAAAS